MSQQRSRARRTPGRPFVVVGVFLLVSLAALPLLILLQGLTGIDADVLRLTVFSTTVGAVVVGLGWRGSLPYPPVVRRGWGGWLWAVLAVAVVLGVLVVLTAAQASPWPRLDPDALSVPLVAELGLLVVGAAGEEVGWRGVVQPALETRWTPLPAAVVTGALFGLGHVYVVAAGLLVFLVFVLGAIGLSLVLAAAGVGRSGPVRIAVATLVHAAVNAGTLVLFADGDESLRWGVTLTMAILVAGAVAAVMLHRTRSVATGTVR